MENMVVRRGEVYLCDLDGAVGNEQRGVRPVVIVQNPAGNKFAPTTIVLPISSSMTKRPLPTHVFLDAKKHNLERDSIIFAEQFRTVMKGRLICKLTELDEEVMREVDRAMAVSLNLQLAVC